MNLFDNKPKDSKLTDIFSTKHSRDYYRGKSFNFAGEWAVNNHYISDDYRVDFVTYKDTLLSCKKSHLSDVTLEPSGFIYDEDSGKTIGIVSEYWEFVLSGLNEEILNDYVLIEDLPVEKGSGENSFQQKDTGAIASGIASVAEGGDNLQGGEPVSGEEKLYSKAEGYASHAEGAAHAIGRYSHAEGGGNSIEEGHPTRSTAEGQYSHAEGSHTYAKGGMTHAEGNLTIAEGYGSHAEGSSTISTGNTSHAEGIRTVAGVGDRPTISTNTEAGNYTHAEGNGTQASGNSAHAEGKHTLAEGSYSHAEGLNTRASGQNSHAEGHSQNNVLDTTVIKSNDGIIEDWGLDKFTLAKGAASHAEGKDNLALGARSHAEGYQTIASGANSHSENYNTKATGANSHAEGASCEAKGERSHVEGFHTETNNASEHAEGSYNKSNTDTRHSVGIGTSESDRKNAFEVMKNGGAYLYGVGDYDGTNPSSAYTLQELMQMGAIMMNDGNPYSSSDSAETEAATSQYAGNTEISVLMYRFSGLQEELVPEITPPKALTPNEEIETGIPQEETGIGIITLQDGIGTGIIIQSIYQTSGGTNKCTQLLLLAGKTYKRIINLGSIDPNTGYFRVVGVGAWSEKNYYSIPSTGIPASDIADGVIPDVSQFVTKSVSDLANYYLKNETYTKEEVLALIAGIRQFVYAVAEVLPSPSADTMWKIFLVPSSDPQARNTKDEFITIEKNGVYSWEQIGSTAVDLSGKADKDTNAEEGNLAEFDSNGNPVDSGISAKDVAKKDGYYVGMTAGAAENLVGRGDSTSASFLFRTTAGSKDIGTGETRLTAVKGNSLVWNQLLKNGDFSNSDGWELWDGATIADGRLQFTGPSFYHHFAFQKINIPRGRKVLLSVKYAMVGQESMWFEIKNDVVGSVAYLDAASTGSLSNFDTLSVILDTSGDRDVDLFAIMGKETETELSVIVDRVSIIDLTLMFGAGNEPATVEEFESMFPLDYYDYNPGTVIPFAAQKLATTGFNQYNYVTGTALLLGGNEYQLTGSYTSATIEGDTVILDANGCFTPTENCVLVITGGNDSDTCVHLVHSGIRNGEYEPYEKHELTIDPANLLDKNGNLVFPYGGMHGNDSIFDQLILGNYKYFRYGKRVFGRVDLGTLEYRYMSEWAGTMSFETVIPDMASQTKNIICSKYLFGLYGEDTTSRIVVNLQHISIVDNNYTDVATFKAAMSGVYLFYELAEPVEVELATPIPSSYSVNDWGTEEWTPENGSIPYTASCNVEIQYSMNAVDTLRNLDRNYVRKDEVDEIVSDVLENNFNTVDILTQTEFNNIFN